MYWGRHLPPHLPPLLPLSQMGINLDTDNNGFGGKDFGLLFDVSAAPSILLKSPSGSPIFKMGGQGGGITATATIYHVRTASH